MSEDTRHKKARPHPSREADERFRVPGAEILEHDTWAEDRTCPNCSRPVTEGVAQCPACGQWIDECAGSCPSCGSPRCIGGRRKR